MPRRAPFVPIQRAAVDLVDAGESAETWAAGDILLTHGDAFISRLIRFGEKLRIHGDDRTYCWFNHAALVLNDQGDLAEALSRGVVRSNAAKYQPKAYAVVRPVITPADTDQVLAFADWVLATHDAYGWFTIASIGISMLTGAKFTFFVDGTLSVPGSWRAPWSAPARSSASTRCTSLQLTWGSTTTRSRRPRKQCDIAL